MLHTEFLRAIVPYLDCVMGTRWKTARLLADHARRLVPLLRGSDMRDLWIAQTRVWGIPLLEEIKIPAMATASTWRKAAPGTTRAPGRNSPELGAWLVRKYLLPPKSAADPMVGVGGLWLNCAHLCYAFAGCDCEESIVSIAAANLLSRVPKDQLQLDLGDARTWCPDEPVALVLTSPPFPQNHSAGATAHQQEIRRRKHLHTMQEFGQASGQLAQVPAADYGNVLAQVYAQIRTYTQPTGHLVVVLRNWVRKRRELDFVATNVAALRWAGWRFVGAHPRRLRVTGYNQWRVARDPTFPWVQTEWALVMRP